MAPPARDGAQPTSSARPSQTSRVVPVVPVDPVVPVWAAGPSWTLFWSETCSSFKRRYRQRGPLWNKPDTLQQLIRWSVSYRSQVIIDCKLSYCINAVVLIYNPSKCAVLPVSGPQERLLCDTMRHLADTLSYCRHLYRQASGQAATSQPGVLFRLNGS